MKANPRLLEKRRHESPKANSEAWKRKKCGVEGIVFSLGPTGTDIQRKGYSIYRIHTIQSIYYTEYLLYSSSFKVDVKECFRSL